MRQLLRVLATACLAIVSLVAVPGVASAHPLGNFTINHYAGIRVSPRAIDLDVVIDMAEIPTFSERPQLDTNGDGTVSVAELRDHRVARCKSLATSLALAVNGSAETLQLTDAGLALLPGAGGLQTLRTVCEYHSPLPQPLAASSQIAFRDGSWPDRIGWREIVVNGDGASTSAPGSAPTSVSARLTHYPTDLLAQPLDMQSAAITTSPGGPVMTALHVSDATPVGESSAGPSTAGLAGAIPGGVGEQLTSLVQAPDLTPLVIVLSLLAAAALGALHAVSPGHGKTVMAAYLVGTRGQARHAVALALAVTVSHTAGVLVLALVTLVASDVLPPERLYPILGLASGLTVVAIGGWLLLARWRELRHRRAHRTDAEHEHVHRHGPFSRPHVHAPSRTDQLSWRGLLALGLAGGLVPSASALLLLLGAVAAGRPAWGLALAVAFGVGMAVVLGGIGLVLAHAGRLIERVPAMSRFAALAPAVPWVTAFVVLAAGFLLTGQALVQRF